METVEKTRDEKTRNRQAATLNRWPTVAIVVLSAAVVAMGATLILDGSSEAEAELTPVQEEMLETIDAYMDAWNAGDGATAAALMAPSGYHDNGSLRSYVAQGDLERFIDGVSGVGFSVSRSDAAFVGGYVMTTDQRPAGSSTDQPSIYKMSPDGTVILWHLAP
jgi:hypothetical protein